jgi:hypothetical protein
LEEKMNKTIKIIVVLFGGLITLCLGLGMVGWLLYSNTGRVLSQTIDNEPTKVAAVREDIADYTLPVGFGEAQAVRLANFSMVSYTAEDGQTHIFLFQAPGVLILDEYELERQMGLATGKDEWRDVTVIESQPCQIRGEESTLIISEGVSHDGSRYRSASAIFDGNGGTALVNISGPSEDWDQEMVDDFIASLQ